MLQPKPVLTPTFNPDLFVGRPTLELISGSFAAPGATFKQLVMNPNDSQNVRNFSPGYRAFIYDAGYMPQATGDYKIMTAQMHDQVDGVHNHLLAGNLYPHWQKRRLQEVFPQDQLLLQITGSAVGGTIEVAWLKILYQSLPASKQINLFAEELDYYALNEVTVGMILPATSGVAGYSGSLAISGAAGSGGWNNLKGNTWYAITGLTVSVGPHINAICIIGPDLGNIRRGVMANPTNLDMTREAFVDESDYFKDRIPTIPCINSTNLGGTFVQAIGDNVATACEVVLHMVQLRDKVSLV